MDKQTKFFSVRKVLAALLLPLLLVGCKEKTYDYVYEVEEQQAVAEAGSKNRQKSDLELVSVAYTDLFGKNIPQEELRNITAGFSAFGDVAITLDVMILNFLNDPEADLPEDAVMHNDPKQFIEDTFKKFYVRKPTAYEEWFFLQQIEENPELTVEEVYYAFLTSDEYRYY